MGWIDCHGHPFCLRIEEVIKLSETISKHAEWKRSPVPFLLISQFVALTSNQEAETYIKKKTKALFEIGLVSQTFPGPAKLDKSNEYYDQIGWEVREHKIGKTALNVVLQKGISWTKNDDGHWELDATKSWDTIRHLRNFDWPVPCHTIRTKNRYKNFPQAYEEVKEQETLSCESERNPEFPFDSFAKMMSLL